MSSAAVVLLQLWLKGDCGVQRSCSDGSPTVQHALLAGSVVLLEAQPQAERPAVLNMLLGTLERKHLIDCKSWRGRLAFAEQGAACAALLNQQVSIYAKHTEAHFH